MLLHIAERKRWTPPSQCVVSAFLVDREAFPGETATAKLLCTVVYYTVL